MRIAQPHNKQSRCDRSRNIFPVKRVPTVRPTGINACRCRSCFASSLAARSRELISSPARSGCTTSHGRRPETMIAAEKRRYLHAHRLQIALNRFARASIFHAATRWFRLNRSPSISETCPISQSSSFRFFPVCNFHPSSPNLSSGELIRPRLTWGRRSSLSICEFKPYLSSLNLF